MALSAEPDKLDPSTSTSKYTRYVMQTICQKLYDIDANGEPVPQLATELPKISSDGLTVTIPLRRDAVFADGSKFDAEAVRISLDRHLNLPGSSAKSDLGPISSIETADANTVRINYKKPFAPLTGALTDRAGMILSAQALESAGKNFGDHPVCVGPFKFVKRVPQTSIEVERDPLFYNAQNVHLDTITYRIMADANIRAANIRSGDVHVADTISPQDIDALIQEDGIGVLQVESLGYEGLTINIGNTAGAGKPAGRIDTPLAQQTAIRRALSMSINREALVNTVFNSWYQAACSPIPQSSRFSTPESENCPPYDPAGAVRLLEEAGVKAPYKIELKVSNSPDTLRFAQALQAAVAIEGGFDLTIIPVEYSTLLDIQARGDFEMLLLGWSGRMDPHSNMVRFLGTGSSNNFSGYNSREVDDLLSAAAKTSILDERAAIYGQAVEKLQEDNPIIYLCRARSLTAYTTKIAGVETFADGVVHLSNAAFVDEPSEGQTP